MSTGLFRRSSGILIVLDHHVAVVVVGFSFESTEFRRIPEYSEGSKVEFKFYLLCEFEMHKECRDSATYGKWVQITHGRKLYRFSDAESRTNAMAELSKVYGNVDFTELEAEVF